jgi:hypothetical protein
MTEGRRVIDAPGAMFIVPQSLAGVLSSLLYSDSLCVVKIISAGETRVGSDSHHQITAVDVYGSPGNV